VIARSKDATRVNAILNHPEVYRWVHGDKAGPLDFAPLVADERNILLEVEGGAFLFVRLRDQAYEVHTQFMPGVAALAAAEEAARYMFVTADALWITTMVPANNVAALKLTERMQFEHLGRGGELCTEEGMIPLDEYILTLKRSVQTRIAPCQP